MGNAHEIFSSIAIFVINCFCYTLNISIFLTIFSGPFAGISNDYTTLLSHIHLYVTLSFSSNPGALLSKTFFGDLVFTGTLMIRSPPFGVRPDDDYVGILFGFQSNRYLYSSLISKKTGSNNLLFS